MTSDSNSSSGSTDSKKYYGIGAGRRRTLDALESKPTLIPIENPESLEELVDAIREISVDGHMSPRKDIINKISQIHGNLPDDAKEEYITDDTLIQRINTARRKFEDFRGNLKRVKEIPSPVEAGRSNYPFKKAQRRSKSYRKGREDLKDTLDNVSSAAGGAKQRALSAIGSSVAEHNEKKREEAREEKKDTLEKGMLVAYRNPRLFAGKIKRVNKKSVRVKRPNPRAGEEKRFGDGVEPEFREARIDLDSSHLTPLLEDSDLDDLQSITNVDAETVDGIEEELFS